MENSRKAFQVKVYQNPQPFTFIGSNSQEIIEVLKNKGLFINEKSENHIKVLTQEASSDFLLPYKSFAAGNNSGNPMVHIEDITGAKNDSLSLQKLNQIKDFVQSKYPKKDLKPYFKLHEDGSVQIVLGLNWYWVEREKRHFPIHEFFYKAQKIDVSEVKAKIINFIKKNK
jgi:hypothetical protein